MNVFSSTRSLGVSPCRRPIQLRGRDALATWITTRLICPAFALVAVSLAGDLTPAQISQRTSIQCNNVIYAGGKTSVCFADKFLSTAATQTQLPILPSFQTVRLDADALFESPFTVISGEDTFRLSDKERANLRQYLTCGGFILASPGCSNPAWDKSFRAEIKAILPEGEIKKIPMTHPLFSTVFDIRTLNLKSGGKTLLEGIELNGRIVMIYSAEGLNDAANAKGCCCCGGNQIRESEHMNVNILLYALLN
jgi:hypothetical protein